MTAPHDLGPWDDLLQTVSLDELRPALQRACAALERQGQPVPRWVRWLGPWEADGSTWGRHEARSGARVRRLYVWRAERGADRWWFAPLGALPKIYDSLSEAVEAAHEDGRQQGYVFDEAMPEEAPAAEPAAPEPTEEAEGARAPARGPGRREGQHVWEIAAGSLWRCMACGLWRFRPLGKGWRYLSAQYPAGHARALGECASGETRAGRCPGRRGP